MRTRLNSVLASNRRRADSFHRPGGSGVRRALHLPRPHVCLMSAWDSPGQMHLAAKLPLLFVILCLNGCIPLRDQATAGHRYSAEALAFLDSPRTTRDEVVKSLGPPLFESAGTRTLLYEWEQTKRYWALEPGGVVHWEPYFTDKVEKGGVRRFGLFIAYDERGFVSAHEVRLISAPTIQEAFIAWSKQRNKTP